MAINKFTFRELQPSDSPALVNLISEFDGDLTTQFLVDAYSALIFGDENQTLGVGVECAGVDGLVGVGTVRLSRVQFNGEVLPLAFLDGLKVHKDFRGQGLGFQIADWRVQRARETLGENCIIATGLLRSNDASRGVAKKWCREFIDTAYLPTFVPVRSRPPKELGGVQVRELEMGEYADFAQKRDAFYKNHNLYPPCSVDAITHALQVSAGGQRPYRFYAAVDARGSLVAGAEVWCRGVLKSDFFANPPPTLRLLNRVAHLLPPDFTLRDAAVIGLWHDAGQQKTARFFVESLGWLLRGQATTLTFALDPRDPLREVTGPSPLLMPRIEITIALQAPAPIDRGRLIFGYGRV